MRKTLLSLAIVATAALAFAAPSQAGGFSIGFDDGYGGNRLAISAYGGDSYHEIYDEYEEPVCFIKTIKKWDKWGNLKIKKVKVCE